MGIEIYKFARSFHAHLFVHFQFVCYMHRSKEEEFLRNNAFSLYHHIWLHSTHHKKPCPRGHEIYNFVRGFHAHHYYYRFSFLLDAQELKRRFLQICINFTVFTQKIRPLRIGGHEINNF